MNFVDSLNIFGVEARQKPSITGSGAPTTETEGAVGEFYMDTVTGDIYKCTAVDDGVYTWMVIETTPCIIPSASGEVISIRDSTSARFRGLNLYGKTTQNGTPTPDAPVELVNVGKGGITVTVTGENDAQSMTIEKPNGLPGIPVTSGGNYTDTNGQQWICDEMDFARGVYVQRIKTLALDGTGNIQATAKHYAIYISGSNLAIDNSSLVNCCCNYYSGVTRKGLDGCTTAVATSGNYIRIIDTVSLTEVNVDTFKAFLAAKYEASNPVTVQYILATPIETPLTEEETAQYAALYTNKLNTAVLNDAGAGMAVEYVADTKTYIDNKFTELQNAILASGANV